MAPKWVRDLIVWGIMLVFLALVLWVVYGD